jgi:hypothetical protein
VDHFAALLLNPHLYKPAVAATKKRQSYCKHKKLCQQLVYCRRYAAPNCLAPIQIIWIVKFTFAGGSSFVFERLLAAS